MNMNKNFSVNKISKLYVTDNCLNLILYKKSGLTLIGPRGMILDGVNGYSSQSLEFDTPYLYSIDGFVSQLMCFNRQNAAYAISLIPFGSRTCELNLNRWQLNKLFEPNDENDVVIVGSSTSKKFYTIGKNSTILPSEDEILNSFKKNLSFQVGEYYYTDGVSRCLSKFCSNITFDDLPSNLNFIRDELFLIRCNGTNIDFKVVSLRFMGPDKYRAILTEVPIKNYDFGAFKDAKVKHLINSKIKLY